VRLTPSNAGATSTHVSLLERRRRPLVEAGGARCTCKIGLLRAGISRVIFERLGRDVEPLGEFSAVSTGERRALAFDRGGIARSVS
jgi:hypothetical protein